MAPPKAVPDIAEVELRVELARDATIHQRMIQILGELPAIGKTQENKQQGFMFRGYDDVLNALNPLLGRHGVYVVPDVVERVTGERTTRNGGTMYEVNLHVRFRFYGLAGDYVEASGWGEGTDSGDKATNKAMTMALKYVLFQAFAISTLEAFDADASTNEETTRARPVDPAAAGFPMPKSWPQIKAGIVTGYAGGEAIYAEFEKWLEAATVHLYAEPSLRSLTPEQRQDMATRAGRAVVYIRDHCDDEIGGPKPEHLAAAWAAVLDGARISLDGGASAPVAATEAPGEGSDAPADAAAEKPGEPPANQPAEAQPPEDAPGAEERREGGAATDAEIPFG